MITIPTEVDLGRDVVRMKDRADVERQTQTTQALLDRMFPDDPADRRSLQLLADEVGMGKTFVALGVAYSLLSHMRGSHCHPDLKGCSPRVLVLTPRNAALSSKWQRDVGEFLRRCLPPEPEKSASEWFKATPVITRSDELAAALARHGGPSIIIAHTGALTGKVTEYERKRRIMLSALFRVWGNRLNREARVRVLKGAPEGWGQDPDRLLDGEDFAGLAFTDEAHVVRLLRAALADPKETALASDVKQLLDDTKEMSKPWKRGRDEAFANLQDSLIEIFRLLCFQAIETDLPLVIVDEAHHWRNRANGCREFERYIAPRTRRGLLLTATPFQLRAREVRSLLALEGTFGAPAGRTSSGLHEVQGEKHEVATPLTRAEESSRALFKAWSRLSDDDSEALASDWASEPVRRARYELRQQGQASDDLEQSELIASALGTVSPHLREFVHKALRLIADNAALSKTLGKWVIRHRRRTDHRLVRVGAEVDAPSERVRARVLDRHLLHAGPGLEVSGDAELVHYLLMRCISLLGEGKHGALGAALTGCYSTLHKSAEGMRLKKLAKAASARHYYDLLIALTNQDDDVRHPKARVIVAAAVDAWKRGEKTLIFCFRTHTAQRLQSLIDSAIKGIIRDRREAVLGGATALTSLRGRFTRRDGDLVVLGLDRVLWSLRWASQSADFALPPLDEGTLRLRDDELPGLARLALTYGIDLTEDRVDRVFLHRAVEHLVSKRLLAESKATDFFRSVLVDMAEEQWVRHPYGVAISTESDAQDASFDKATDADAQALSEMAGIDERGVHTEYRAVRAPDFAAVDTVARALAERRERARAGGQISILDSYAESSSFWLGEQPGEAFLSSSSELRVSTSHLHEHLTRLMRDGKKLEWRERQLVFQALRRVLMRESMLLRLLPTRADRTEGTWGNLLVRAFFAPLEGQRESMAHRLAVFVEDLQAAAGKIVPRADNDGHEEHSSRRTLYEATRMRDGFVALIDGSAGTERRERVFAGFNSPLLPEVLVCTSVGQEGIDLHRYCRNVVHYDMGWNPAIIEQRTGRVDRIGSQASRERAAHHDAASADDADAFLHVALPYLAGTYDERMYEELRMRAQMFEALTGGDFVPDESDTTDGDDAEGEERGWHLAPLPQGMLDHMRVRLEVWAETEPGAFSVAPQAAEEAAE